MNILVCRERETLLKGHLTSGKLPKVSIRKIADDATLRKSPIVFERDFGLGSQRLGYIKKPIQKQVGDRYYLIGWMALYIAGATATKKSSCYARAIPCIAKVKKLSFQMCNRYLERSGDLDGKAMTCPHSIGGSTNIVHGSVLQNYESSSCGLRTPYDRVWDT